MTTSKFKAGDKVRIVKYGSTMWVYATEHTKMFEAGFASKSKPDNILSEKNGVYWYDPTPSIVGKIGTVEGSYGDLYDYTSNDEQENIRRSKQYSINGIPEKSAWYNEDQLELVKE